MKPALVCSSLLVLLLLLVPASAQRKNDINSSPISPAPYRLGERLTYNVSFSNFISAAHFEFHVLARGNFFGREGIHLRAHAETKGLINVALVAINNDYISYVDPQTGLPYRSQQIIRESAHTSDSSNEFQPATGTYDVVSALYRVRALPLAEGSSYSLSVRSEGRDYPVELKVGGRDTVKTNVGSFNAIVTYATVKNSPLNLDNIRIYFSEDERHIPLLLTARHRAGEVRVELAASELLSIPTAKPSPTPAPVRPVNPPAAAPQPPAETNPNLEGLPFDIGEQLNYQVFLGNVSQVAATASFHVRSRSRYFDRDGLLMAVNAQTTNAIQRVFFANDKITSYLDPKTLLPFRVETNLIEGRERSNQVLTINQNYGSASTDKGERIDIPIGTHDYVSFFYAVRTFDLTPQKRHAISILVNNRPKTLFISAMKRESIRLGNQEVPAIQLSLTTDDPQADKYQLRAWVSADARRLPLRLTAQTPAGQVRADLAIIPLTSQ